MPSFDIISEVDMQEVNNAVDQANRELTNRFDFKGIAASFSIEKETIILKAPEEFHLHQMLPILQSKIIKRKLDAECLKPETISKNLAQAKQNVLLQSGIDQDIAKKIIKEIKASKTKVQTSIQGEKLRVTGKKRDDLQEAIALVKEKSWGIPLQYDNFRD